LSNGAIRDIYTGPSACEISDVYNAFGNEGQMFITRDPMHRDKKKRIAHLFSNQSMNELEPFMYELGGKLFDIISQQIGKPINIMHWVRMLNLDLAGKTRFYMEENE
jgi:cytochrome P450